MDKDPIVKFEGEDRIFLNFEKNVLGSEGIKTTNKAAELGPVSVNQMTVCNIDEVEIMPPWVGNGAMWDWECGGVDSHYGTNLPFNGVHLSGGESLKGKKSHGGFIS